MSQNAFNKIMRGLEEARTHIQATANGKFCEVDIRKGAILYLGECISVDLPCKLKLNTLAGPQAVKDFADHYGVSRTLVHTSDSRDSCLAWVHALLVESDLSPEDLPAFADALAHSNNGKRADSAATKLMWLRFPDRITIYDSVAWKWLQERHDDTLKNSDTDIRKWYPNFVDAWNKEFDSVKESIRTVALELAVLNDFISKIETESNPFSGLVDSEWFHRRVFDRCILEAPHKS